MQIPTPPTVPPPEAPQTLTVIAVAPVGTVYVCAAPVYPKLVVAAAAGEMGPTARPSTAIAMATKTLRIRVERNFTSGSLKAIQAQLGVDETANRKQDRALADRHRQRECPRMIDVSRQFHSVFESDPDSCGPTGGPHQSLRGT